MVGVVPDPPVGRGVPAATTSGGSGFRRPRFLSSATDGSCPARPLRPNARPRNHSVLAACSATASQGPPRAMVSRSQETPINPIFYISAEYEPAGRAPLPYARTAPTNISMVAGEDLNLRPLQFGTRTFSWREACPLQTPKCCPYSMSALVLERQKKPDKLSGSYPQHAAALDHWCGPRRTRDA